MKNTTFKPGDRVRYRYVIEGESEIRQYSDRFHTKKLYIAAGDVYPWIDDKNLKLELIEPEIVLPTVPGSVVQVDPLNELGQRMVYELDSDGEWWPSGYGHAHEASAVADNCREFGYRMWEAAE